MFFDWSELLIGLALLGSCVACSVKEERSSCPCLLTLDVEAPGDVRLMLEGRSFEMDETLPGDTVVTYSVPRPDVRICAVSGVPWNNGIVIPQGEDCPEIYMGICRVGTNSYEAREKVPLHKSYCTLIMNFNGPPGWRPLPVTLLGEFCGYFPDGSPRPGAFRYSTEPMPGGVATGGSGGVCTVRLPRQRNSSLMLRLGDEWTFALGEFIAESGYDWLSPDLDDICLDINVSLTQVTFHSRGFTHTEELWFLI